MPGLLDLPSELLFEIIRLVDSTPYLSTANCKRYRPARLQSRAVVCFPTVEPSRPTHTHGLLLACKRLNAEASIFFSKLPQMFELDIAVVNNHWIWPTWRYIPRTKLEYLLETFQVNLIDCCTEDDRTSFDIGVLNLDTSLELLKVISHFLHHGPTSENFESARMAGGRHEFRIKTLIINVDTDKSQHGNGQLSDYDIPCRRVEGLAHLTFDPLYAIDTATCLDHVDRLAEWVNMVLYRGLHSLTIRERVDQIVFSADGRMRNVMNIAKYMSEKQEARISAYKRNELVESST
jgi:hypothetical protein